MRASIRQALMTRLALRRRKKLDRKRRIQASTTSNRKDPNIVELEKNKKIQKKLKKEWVEAWKKSEPSVNVKAYMQEYDNVSEKASKPILDNALKVLALINATEYANDALEDKFKAQGTRVPTEEIEIYSARMMRIKILEMTAEVMSIDSAYLERIIGIQIVKDFGTLAPTINAPPVKRNNVIKKVMKAGGNGQKKESVFTKKRQPVRKK